MLSSHSSSPETRVAADSEIGGFVSTQEELNDDASLSINFFSFHHSLVRFLRWWKMRGGYLWIMTWKIIVCPIHFFQCRQTDSYWVQSWMNLLTSIYLIAYALLRWLIFFSVFCVRWDSSLFALEWPIPWHRVQHLDEVIWWGNEVKADEKCNTYPTANCSFSNTASCNYIIPGGWKRVEMGSHFLGRLLF